MELVTTKTVLASDMGLAGNLFGGVMLSWLDLAGAAYVMEICDSPRFVTKKFEEVIFEKPVKTGNLIKIYASVIKFGNSSINVLLEARKHNVESGNQQIVCKTTVIFVKINEDGEPIPISDRVKTRYEVRYKKYGKGLLTPEEIEREKPTL